MPPKTAGKQKDKAAGAKGILGKYRKDVKKKVAVEKKELDVSEITEELIKKTSQITILKKWAVKLKVPNIASYKTPQINRLKEVMLKYFLQMKQEEEENKEPVIVSAEEEDNDLEKQYAAIEAFLKAQLNDKVTSVYGQAGDNFVDMWNQLDKNQKKLFLREYFELNVEPMKVTPVLYLKNFLANIKEVPAETPITVTRRYLSLFIRDNDKTLQKNPRVPEQMLELERSPLFSAQFMQEFQKLDLVTQLKFARVYIRHPTNPVDALALFLNPVVVEPPPPRRPIKKVFIGGIPRYFPVSEEDSENFAKNNYKKCVLQYRGAGLAIKPISLPDGTVGAEIKEGFHHPTDDFYMLLCEFRVAVTDPRQSIVQIGTEKKYSAEVKKVNGDKLSDITPYDLKLLIARIESGNIFAKLDPVWILQSPVYQVEERFRNYPFDVLNAKNDGSLSMFHKVISGIQTESRNDTLLVYYTRLFTLLFPFLTFEPARTFASVERLKKRYITAETFANMSLAERIPEIPLEVLVPTIENFVRKNAPGFVKNANAQGKLSDMSIVVDKFTSVREKCPAFEAYQLQDIIIYTEDGKDYCFSVPELLTQFLDGNTTNKQTGEPFSAPFVKSFLANYEHLKGEKFVKTVDGKEEDVYVDKDLYDLAHPVPVKRQEKYSLEDVAGQFDAYFEPGPLIEDPILLIQTLIAFDLDQQCQACSRLVSDPVRSMLDRSDGTTIPVGFCDYQCMSDYSFRPLHVAEELSAPEMTAEKLIESV